MARKHKGLIVAFKNDIHEDYIEKIINAINMFEGVASVSPVEADINDQINRMQIKNEFKKLFIDFFQQHLQ